MVPLVVLLVFCRALMNNGACKHVLTYDHYKICNVKNMGCPLLYERNRSILFKTKVALIEIHGRVSMLMFKHLR